MWQTLHCRTNYALSVKQYKKIVFETNVWFLRIYNSLTHHASPCSTVFWTFSFLEKSRVKRLVRVNVRLVISIRHCCLFWLRSLFWRSIQCLVIQKKPQRNIDNFISGAFKHFTVQLHKSIKVCSKWSQRLRVLVWGSGVLILKYAREAVQVWFVNVARSCVFQASAVMSKRGRRWMQQLKTSIKC